MDEQIKSTKANYERVLLYIRNIKIKAGEEIAELEKKLLENEQQITKLTDDLKIMTEENTILRNDKGKISEQKQKLDKALSDNETLKNLIANSEQKLKEYNENFKNTMETLEKFPLNFPPPPIVKDGSKNYDGLQSPHD